MVFGLMTEALCELCGEMHVPPFRCVIKRKVQGMIAREHRRLRNKGRWQNMSPIQRKIEALKGIQRAEEKGVYYKRKHR